jgi:MoaA/NifB/PqqE/SkfB family radical SAM enzyme
VTPPLLREALGQFSLHPLKGEGDCPQAVVGFWNTSNKGGFFMYRLIKSNKENIYWCMELNQFFYIDNDNSEYFEIQCINSLEVKKIPLNVPINLVWRITNHCNFKCAHCFSTEKSHSYEEEENIRRKVIEDLIDLAPLKINFTGGEPILIPDFVDIVQKLKEKKIILTLTSNGYALDEYIGKLLNLIDWFIISIDHYSAEKNDIYRNRKGAFVKSVEIVRMLVSSGKMTRVNSVITKHNVDDMEEMVVFFKSLGIQYYEMIQFLAKNKAIKRRNEFEIEKKIFFNKAMELKKKYETENFKIKINTNTTHNSYMIIEDDGLPYSIYSDGRYVKIANSISELKNKIEIYNIDKIEV